MAVLDSGATISIISIKLVKKLGFSITEPFNTVVITANDTQERALEKLVGVKLVVQSILVPTNFQVIKNPNEIMLLEMDWFQKVCAWLYFDEKKLFIRYLEKGIEIPIYQSKEDN